MRTIQQPLFTPETEWVMPEELKNLKGAKEKTDKLLLETKDDEDKKILEQLKDHLKSMALL